MVVEQIFGDVCFDFYFIIVFVDMQVSEIRTKFHFCFNQKYPVFVLEEEFLFFVGHKIPSSKRIEKEVRTKNFMICKISFGNPDDVLSIVIERFGTIRKKILVMDIKFPVHEIEISYSLIMAAKVMHKVDSGFKTSKSK